MPRPKRILTVNSGSSSLKFALYNASTQGVAMVEKIEYSGTLDRIGLDDGRFSVRGADTQLLHDEHVSIATHASALQHVLAWLDKQPDGRNLDAAGHRIVHGGRWYTQPERITPEVIARLKELIPLAPAHLPNELAAIDMLGAEYPDMPQVACFDTAFHRNMPRVAQLFGLPRELLSDGVVRYGFHGLSYEYILGELARAASAEVASGRVVIAHLGNGSSMIAVAGGRSIDTTMGFTPMGGLIMSTRPGDLDPGVPLFLLQARGMSASDLATLFNQRSGLLGVSGTSSDMRDLLERSASDTFAAEAVSLYCYVAKKTLGGLAAALGGLDTLVFTGGIGENAAAIRWSICANLEVLGVQLDEGRNAANAPIISGAGSRVQVRVMKTDEDLMIARHTVAVLDIPEGAGGE